MKAPCVVYADFEFVLEKIAGCEPPQNASFTVKTERHVPCGFSYIAVRSDGKLFGPFNHRGKDAVYVFNRTTKGKCVKTWRTKGRWL